MPVQEAVQPVVSVGSEGERIAFGGFEIVFKAPAAGSSEGWMASEATLPPRQMGAPLHYHRELTESFYVVRGELWMRVGGREFVAGPGSYALVPPGTLHSFANRSDAPVRFMAHASHGYHKDFLTELFQMAIEEGAWPPRDINRAKALGARYDSYYAKP